MSVETWYATNAPQPEHATGTMPVLVTATPVSDFCSGTGDEVMTAAWYRQRDQGLTTRAPSRAC